MNRNQAEKVLFDVLGNHKRLSNESLFFCPECGHHKQKLSVNLIRTPSSAGSAIIVDATFVGLFVVSDLSTIKKWDEITGRVDYDKFAEDLFDEKKDVEPPQKLSLPEDFVVCPPKTYHQPPESPMST